MDGYAVRAADVRAASEASPVALKVIGAVAAGQLPTDRVTPGTAVRIMTGAPIPDGADAVVPFESTDEEARRSGGRDLAEIGILAEVRSGADVRAAGQDVAKGDLVMESGTVLGPAEIGVLASLGKDTARVVRRPLVAILATGDELIEPGSPPEPGKIFDSNTFGLAAAVSRVGGVPKILGIAGDSLDSMNSKLYDGLEADALITSAGVSKGDYDMVKDVLAQRGRVEFWSVRMRPAKPLAFGLIVGRGDKKVPLLGFPGNPVSALVAFEQFGRAAIHKMLGKGALRHRVVDAVLEEPIYNTDGRRVYARVVLAGRDGAYSARLTGAQGSNLLTSLVHADGLAICPEDEPLKDVGEVVKVQMFDWSEKVI
jgi:molybdopterin molybdotransferase